MAETIKVDEIEEGLVLSEAIVNSFGQVILGAGTVLKNKHKMLLRTWDVEKINIKTSDDEEVTSVAGDLVSMAREMFSRRCSWQSRNKFEEEIINLGVGYLADKMANIDKKGQ